MTFEIARLSYKQDRKGLPKQNRYISRQMKTSVKEKKKIKDNKSETKHSVTPCGAFGPKDPKEEKGKKRMQKEKHVFLMNEGMTLEGDVYIIQCSQFGTSSLQRAWCSRNSAGAIYYNCFNLAMYA